MMFSDNLVAFSLCALSVFMIALFIFISPILLAPFF